MLNNGAREVLKITRTIYVLKEEAEDEQDAWNEYYEDCPAELSKDDDIIEEGTNASFGRNLESQEDWFDI